MNDANDATARMVGKERNRTVRMLGHWVYLRRCLRDDPRDTEGRINIVLPEGMANFTQLAEVLGAGPDCHDLRKGDMVMLPSVCGEAGKVYRQPFGDTEEWVMDEDQLLARFREDE